MNRLVLADFVYKRKDHTEVNGVIYFLENKGILYAPVKIDVTNGTLSLSHNLNSGKDSASTRKNKNKIIKKYCDTSSGVSAEIIKPFQADSKGLVGFMSLISGSHQTNNGDIKLKYKQLLQYKAAKLFQNLKSFKGYTKISEVISMDQFIETNKGYINKLEADYYQNIDTASKE